MPSSPALFLSAPTTTHLRARVLTRALIRRPAWRVWSALGSLRHDPTSPPVADPHLDQDIHRIRLHPAVPEVVDRTLHVHLKRRIRAPHLGDDLQDDLLLHALRPRSPGWQLTGVVAVLLAAGDVAAAQALVDALPEPQTGAAARRRTAVHRMLHTGMWGQGHAARSVVHPRLLHTVRPTVDHLRSMARRSWRFGTRPSIDLWASARLLPPRTSWHGYVWAGLDAAGPHLRDADRSLRAMPHPAARDRLRMVLAEAAIALDRPEDARTLVAEILSARVRTDAIAHVCDQLHIRGALNDLETWLPALARDRDASTRALATVLQMQRCVETTQTGLDSHARVVFRHAVRQLPRRPGPWTLLARPTPDERHTLLVALGGGPAPALARHASASVVRAAMLSRLHADTQAAERIAIAADGSTAVSDPLIAGWLRTRGPAINASEQGLSPVVRASLQGVVGRGFMTAWRLLRQRCSPSFSPEAWLHSFRMSRARWPTAWELPRPGRARRFAAPTPQLTASPPSAPVHQVLAALPWSSKWAHSLHQGRSWHRITATAHVKAIDSESALEWVEGRWAHRLPDGLSHADRLVVHRALRDPLQLVWRQRPRIRSAPATALWIVELGLAVGSPLAVARLRPPVGAPTHDTIPRVIEVIANACRRLGFAFLAVPATLPGAAGERRPGLLMCRLSDHLGPRPAVQRPNERWINLSEEPPVMGDSVQSLTEPVLRPGTMANGIAAPRRGTHRQAVDFAYVRTDD